MNEIYYWVYILNCENGAFYTGYTTDLIRRYHEHLEGSSKYTRSFKPLNTDFHRSVNRHNHRIKF